MKLATSVLALALVGSAFAAACSSSPKGKTAPQPTVAATETAVAEAPPTAAPVDTGAPAASSTPTTAPSAPPAKPTWASMSKDQKTEVMKTAVMPKMTTDFQGADAKRYAKFSCATCHGAGVKDGSFAMPNAGLPKLTTDGKFAAEMKKNAKVTKFMMEVVVPDMATALGVAPYDPATKQGFGCFNCHSPAKAPTKS
jgi:hypothetical protein